MTHSNLAQERASSWKDVNRTRLFVVIQGTIGGLAGIAHGIFAVLLGSMPTSGLILDPQTGAFTILPTYLISGIAAVCVGLALIFWNLSRGNHPGRGGNVWG